MLLQGCGVGEHVFIGSVPGDWPEEENDYINGPLMASWRTHEKACRDLESRLYTERRLSHFLVVEDEGLNPEKMRSYYDLPEEVQNRIDPLREQLRQDAWLTIPPPIPPRFPEGMKVFHKGVEILRESCPLEPPKDPIRISHDKWWDKIFSDLKELGYDLDRTEIPNQYYDDRNNNEPWYTFVYKGVKFEIGPRKRVDSIKMSADFEFPCKGISDQAKKDGTTFYADKGWQDWCDKARSLRVHAWSKEKTVEYLDLIFKEL